MPEAATLTLKTNIPEEIALQFSEGRTVEGKFGPRMMFTLVDGRRLYAPPLVQELIAKAQIAKGQPFLICKSEVKDGANGKITWEVKRVDPPAGQPGIAPPASRPAGPSASNDSLQPNGSTVAAPHNGNGANGPGRMPDAPYSHTGWAAHLRDQATSLIDVAASCHRYAAEKYPGMLRPEDVSDLLTTVYIGMNQKGGTR